MGKKHDFSETFEECMQMMETLSAYPLLVEKLTKETLYKDFYVLMSMYCEDI